MDRIESESGKYADSGSTRSSTALSQESVEEAQLDRIAQLSPDIDGGFELEKESDFEYQDASVENVPDQKMDTPQNLHQSQSDMNPLEGSKEIEAARGESEFEEIIDEDKNMEEERAGTEGGQAVVANEEEDGDAEAAVSGKKTVRKPKKKVEKRTAFDGRDVVFVTECTQTDWKWRDKIEKTGRGKVITPRMVKSESREAVSRTHTEGGSTMDSRTATDITPFSLLPNDEFGIPLLDMSSDSDSSDEDGPKKVKTHRHHLPTIGPPQILKYVRESDRMDKDTDRTSSEYDDERHLLESTDYTSGGQSPGMFGGTCEFCANDIKPFPTLEQQLTLAPESLYCCEEYREFVEFAMTTANRLEEDVAKRSEKISIKVHPHHGSKMARKMAKEQAVLRMREREMQRRQQEATGMQAAYFNSGAVGQASRPGKNTGGAMMFKDMASYESTKMAAKPGEINAGDGKTKKKRKSHVEDGKDVKEHSSIDKKGEEGTREGGGGGGGGRHTDKRHSTTADTGGGGGGGNFPAGVAGHGSSQPSAGVPGLQYGALGNRSFSGFMGPEVARQMKTINYQLSSQRCLEEGWTLRAPSPLDLNDLDVEVFEPEPLHPAMIATGKVNDRQLIEKFYPDGSKFLTMFPDGTGNVFYPSGHLAIVILSISLGQNTYIVYDDKDNPELLAIFGPNGIGCCHFANGKIRLNYDQMEGLELDFVGGKKRLWSWRDQETHVHAPPFQPIVFGMNRNIGVRFMAQESIALTLTGKKRSCRFNVGAKLKLVSPENLQPKAIDENQLYIDERKVRVDTILDKVSTLLKFPKSPKVDRILPPLSIKSRQQKVEKLKKDYISSTQEQNSGKKSKKTVKQSRLSPLPVISVN